MKPCGQAWGIAFRKGDSYNWCYGQGPYGWDRSTKRAALMNALMSNNGRLNGPFVPLPLPGLVAFDDQDLKPFCEGPYGDELNILYRDVDKFLRENPNADYHELPVPDGLRKALP